MIKPEIHSCALQNWNKFLSVWSEESVSFWYCIDAVQLAECSSFVSVLVLSNLLNVLLEAKKIDQEMFDAVKLFIDGNQITAPATQPVTGFAIEPRTVSFC